MDALDLRSRLAEAMGMQVYYYDIERKLSIGNAKSVTTLEELLALSDIVTLHVPETPLSRHMIQAEQLARMKKNAYLINSSRGNVIDNEALAQALKQKMIKGAALDVFPDEPEDSATPFVNPLQRLENVILTPHIGGATEKAIKRISPSRSLKS